MSKEITQAQKILNNLRKYERNGIYLSSTELSIYKLGFSDGILFQQDKTIDMLKKDLSKAGE